MKRLLPLCALLVAACATSKPPAPHYSPPTVSPVRQQVEKATAAVGDSRASIKSAQENLAAANTSAASLAEKVAPALKPELDGLQMRLSMALRDLAAADARASAAEEALRNSESEAERLQSQIDDQTRQLNAEAAEKNQALLSLSKETTARKLQTGLAWKWRLIALGEALLVAAFFVARQYFPLLKLI